MLLLNLTGLNEERKQGLTALMQENTGALAIAKQGEERYRDSQGWLDTNECAGEEQLKRIEEQESAIAGLTQNLDENARLAISCVARNDICFVVARPYAIRDNLAQPPRHMTVLRIRTLNLAFS